MFNMGVFLLLFIFTFSLAIEFIFLPQIPLTAPFLIYKITELVDSVRIIPVGVESDTWDEPHCGLEESWAVNGSLSCQLDPGGCCLSQFIS